MTRTAWGLLGGVAIAGLLCIATAPSRALGVSIVKDPWSLSEAAATVRKLSDQYRAMVDQLAAAKSQVSALTSHSGYGQLLNGSAEQSARRYMPDAWRSATTGELGTTNPATHSNDRN